ncbi:Dabb family protein [Candidatus Sulfidibacterium hydrothermale]|uniref:Dabb family protein n=1 Tax=Candidatus Sulfidibacterium hydrothermale TaxID=2875962 RepID=UPI001F0A8D05|nr:Dabb family protein [Candidatus Sulfidibacterium hydrothermale]UBM62030.1 Dabb family protein [Candidatus Sulfidibacterium hydrothermale]
MMKKFFLIVVVLLAGVVGTQAMAPFGKKPTAIREIILVKFKKDIPATQKEELIALIEELKHTKTIEKVEWGKRVDYTGASKEYDQCLMLKFKNDNNMEIFQANPLRMRMLGKLMAMSDKMLRFTYHIE